LPDTFPGISFDAGGVCNYCRNTPVASAEEKIQHRERFERLIEEKRRAEGFDCILAYSGGKDSTYTLMMLRRTYGLKVLAFTFDNGFVSHRAMENIREVTDRLGATSMVLKPPFELMRRVFARASDKVFYSPKTLDRASSICTTCIGMVKALVLKTALNHRIPLVAYGWSPGQAPISSAVMQTNPRIQRISQRTVKDPLVREVGDEVLPYFLDDVDLSTDPALWPVNVHPLAFTEYDEDEILRKIQETGWLKPEDTDPNSTNCLLNSLANHLHKQRFSFHPYAWEVAGIVRSGCMEREAGLTKVGQEEDMDMVRYAAGLLGISV
jgi:hypothetical protein